MIEENCMPAYVRDKVTRQLEIFSNGTSVQQMACIPSPQNIRLIFKPDQPAHWVKVPDVTAVFVDMIGSTAISSQMDDKVIAGLYQLFTGTAIRIFNEFDAAYIDVKGDGVFALFNHNQVYHALAAAVSFKTFSEKVFVKKAKQKIAGVETGCHIGIDRKNVLVRRIGLKPIDGQHTAHNEVWAGKPVNMSAKLASISSNGQLLVSDRYFSQLKDDMALKTCGCETDQYGNRRPGAKVDLWTPKSVAEYGFFDFEQAHLLSSTWCEIHGADYCNGLIALDGKP